MIYNDSENEIVHLVETNSTDFNQEMVNMLSFVKYYKEIVDKDKNYTKNEFEEPGIFIARK